MLASGPPAWPSQRATVSGPFQTSWRPLEATQKRLEKTSKSSKHTQTREARVTLANQSALICICMQSACNQLGQIGRPGRPLERLASSALGVHALLAVWPAGFRFSAKMAHLGTHAERPLHNGNERRAGPFGRVGEKGKQRREKKRKGGEQQGRQTVA